MPALMAMDEDAFRTLVSGEVTTLRWGDLEVSIILKDIGIFRLANICLEAQRAAALTAYQDDRFPERPCDHCGKPYRGPAVYCSLDCAVADA